MRCSQNFSSIVAINLSSNYLWIFKWGVVRQIFPHSSQLNWANIATILCFRRCTEIGQKLIFFGETLCLRNQRENFSGLVPTESLRTQDSENVYERWVQQIATLYSARTLVLSMFSKELRNLRWSCGELLKVITQPKNLWGSDSKVFSWTFSPEMGSVRKKATGWGLPLTKERVRHLDGLNVSPIEVAFSWILSWRFWWLLSLFEIISKSSAKGFVMTLELPRAYPCLSFLTLMKSMSGWKTTLKIIGE